VGDKRKYSEKAKKEGHELLSRLAK